MRKRLCILAVLCVFVVSSTSTTAVSAYYGLEWGFEVGDQFHFRISGTPFVPIVDYYVEIDSIPFDFNVSNDEVFRYNLDYYTTYDDNGTEMVYPQVFLAFPIGNWSYFQDDFNETILDFAFSETLDWIDTETEWGFIATMNVSSTLMTTTAKFSKIDGVMNLMRSVVDPEIGLTATMQIERREPQANPILSTEVVIGIGVGIAALVIVGAAIKFR